MNISVGTHSHLFIIVSLIAVFAMHTPSSPSPRHIAGRIRACHMPFREGFLLASARDEKGSHMYLGYDDVGFDIGMLAISYNV